MPSTTNVDPTHQDESGRGRLHPSHRRASPGATASLAVGWVALLLATFLLTGIPGCRTAEPALTSSGREATTAPDVGDWSGIIFRVEPSIRTPGDSFFTDSDRTALRQLGGRCGIERRYGGPTARMTPNAFYGYVEIEGREQLAYRRWDVDEYEDCAPVRGRLSTVRVPGRWPLLLQGRLPRSPAEAVVRPTHQNYYVPAIGSRLKLRSEERVVGIGMEEQASAVESAFLMPASKVREQDAGCDVAGIVFDDLPTARQARRRLIETLPSCSLEEIIFVRRGQADCGTALLDLPMLFVGSFHRDGQRLSSEVRFRHPRRSRWRIWRPPSLELSRLVMKIDGEVVQPRWLPIRLHVATAPEQEVVVPHYKAIYSDSVNVLSPVKFPHSYRFEVTAPREASLLTIEVRTAFRGRPDTIEAAARLPDGSTP